MPLVIEESTAKSINDKSDFSYVMSKITPKNLNSYLTEWRKAARQGLIDPKFIDDKNYQPTHVIDIYKNRQGKYKNVRIWINLDLGTGERHDLFMTTADNQPINEPLDIFKETTQESIEWRDALERST